MDEMQKSAALSDKDFLDFLRAVNCSFVAALQDPLSLVPVVGSKESAHTITSKFRNKLIYSAESWESAETQPVYLGSAECGSVHIPMAEARGQLVGRKAMNG